MCDSGEPIKQVHVTQCAHGNFHLYLGKLTVHLTPRELCLLAKGIAPWLEGLPDANETDHPPRLNWN